MCLHNASRVCWLCPSLLEFDIYVPPTLTLYFYCGSHIYQHSQQSLGFILLENIGADVGPRALPLTVVRGSGRKVIWKVCGSQNTIHGIWLKSGHLLLPTCFSCLIKTPNHLFSFLVNHSYLPSRSPLLFASVTVGNIAILTLTLILAARMHWAPTLFQSSHQILHVFRI